MITPKIRDAQGNVSANSVSKIVKLNIGGVEQYLMIRGESIQNPLLLFVHGGPGQAEIGYIRAYQKALEKHFTVIRWDQRGAGLSAKNIPNDSFTIDVFLADLNEVTDYLIQKFQQPKILIAGHSWGTILATYAVKNHPNKYSAYIGIGQVVNSIESEKISYRYAKEQAKMRNDKKVLKELAKIGRPPHSEKDAPVQANCLAKMGAVIKTAPPKSMISSLLASTEYDLKHKLRYYKNCFFSAKTMYSHVMKINFLQEIKQLEIPVFLIAGKYDYVTPSALVKEFYEGLVAPKKEFIVFEHSAHLPQLEEYERFSDTLIKIHSSL